nr:MAG TPA: hypothetical protein [Caudoviricetes sp.]
MFISFNFNPSYDIIILYYMKDFFIMEETV